MNGVIKRIVRDKGFGFIRVEDGTEYFFHRSACGRGVSFETLSEGERVEFEEESGKGDKGPRAGSVERA